MKRTSAAVKQGGDEPRSSVCTTGRGQIGNDLLRLPIDPFVDSHEAPLAIDHGRAKGVSDVPRIGQIAVDGQPEPGREMVDFVAVAGHEAPGARIGAQYAGVRLEHLRRVICRIETDGRSSARPLQPARPVVRGI